MATHPAADASAIQRGHHNVDAAHALFAATAQMGLSLRESQGPVADLGALLTRLSEMLATVRAAGHSQISTEVIGQLQGEVFNGIQQLQFYDRLVQHLTHIERYLISVANELGSVRNEADSPAPWDELHARLRKRLISDEQRGLLDLFLSPEMTTKVSAQAPRVDYSPPGSFEMF